MQKYHKLSKKTHNYHISVRNPQG